MASFLRAPKALGLSVLALATVAGAQVVSAQERKTAELGQGKDVIVSNAVEGRTSILALKPHGARVAKGEIVCELDSAGLKDQLTNQEIGINSAEASFQNAKLTREVAEFAVIEYVEGIFKQQLAKAVGEVAISEANAKRADDRVEWTRRMVEKGYVSSGQLTREKLAAQKTKFVHEQAQTRKNVLEKFTKEKTVKELKSLVEKAQSDETAMGRVWELELAKAEKLRRQIDSCKVVAPSNGRVSYARAFVAGDIVLEGQQLFRIVPDEEPKAAPK
jgi:hypothetical protein